MWKGWNMNAEMDVGFEVFTVVSKMQVLRVWRFVDLYMFTDLFAGAATLPEDVGGKFVRNVSNYLPVYTMSYPSWLESSIGM
jgi:hypothetical protein